MQKYDIEFAGEIASKRMLLVVKRPNIPAPEIEYETFNIPGRDGVLYTSYATVSDIEIEVEFNYMGKPEQWFEHFGKAKKWLLGKTGNLAFADDKDHFYRVKKVVIDTNERVCYEIGRFIATFYCAGYRYITQGTQGKEIRECKRNPYETCHPIYKINGEGMCYLTVNGKEMSANVSGNLTIDTERMVAYREDGVIKNTEVKGDYEDMYLKTGDNSISFRGGSCKVIPNWREL